MLEVRNLVKVYKPKKGKEVKALNGVSIKFPEKGLVFILGKSGCGKSTLLNMMGGLDRVDSGEIIIKGKSSKDFTQADFDSYRNTYLGFIFQEYNILNEFTVGANVALAIELQGRKATKEEINDILRQVEMEEYATRKPMQLSGGQKQRIAIARALVKNPEIILADEPTGALDSKTGIQVFDTLKELSKTKLVIVVSHDREFAESYGDRVIELKDGEVISDIEKYVAESEKKNESISIIDDKIIQIEQGYELTKDDVKMINDYLKKNKAIISIDETSNRDLKKFARIDDSGNKECFKDTDETEIVYERHQKFKLIKSRLPFKDSFKIGASGLKAKPVRLVISILLSFVAFTLFGLADTINAYNKYTTTYNSLVDSHVENISFEKQVGTKNENSDYVNYNSQKMTDEDFEKLKQKTGLDYTPVLSPVNELSFSNNVYKASGNFMSAFATSAKGYIELEDNFIQNSGFTYVGKIPTENDEIMIPEYIYRTFKEYGYTFYSGSPKTSYEKGADELATPAAFLAVNPTLHIGYNSDIDYKIVGILDTKFDYDHFSSLMAENSGSNVMDWLLLQELQATTQYGYHDQIFVKKGFVAANYPEDENIGYSIGWNSGNQNVDLNYEPTTTGGNYVSVSRVLSKKDLDDNAIQYKILSPSGAETINKTDFLISIDKYKEMLSQYYRSIYGDTSSDSDWVDAPDWIKWDYNWHIRENIQNEFYAQLVVKAKNNGFKYGWYNNTDNVWVEYDAAQQAQCEEDWTTQDKYYNVNTYLTSIYNNSEYPEWVTDSDGVHYNSADEWDRSFARKADDQIYTAAIANLTALQSGIDYSFYRNYNNRAIGKYDQYQTVTSMVVGVFYSSKFIDGSYSNTVVVDDEMYGEVGESSGGKYAFAIAPMNQSKLKNIIKWAYNNEEAKGNMRVKYELQAGPMVLLGQVNSLLEDLAKVFLWVGLGLAVFAGLLMMNYIATTISYKKREIGILRAVGARSVDVFTIFLNESLIIAFINFVLSAGATFGVVYYLNSMLRTDYKITLTLLNFGIRQVGLILLIAVFVAALASAIPVFNISRKKPIDAIRSE